MSRLDKYEGMIFGPDSMCIPVDLTHRYPNSRKVEDIDEISSAICHNTGCDDCPWYNGNQEKLINELFESVAQRIPKKT